jgi:hypothetical protein
MDNKRKAVKSAFLFEAIIVPGTRIAGDSTINETKQGKGIKLSYDELGLHVEQNGVKALIPAANVRSLIWE